MAINITTADATDPTTAGYEAIWAIINANAYLSGRITRRNDWNDETLERPLQAVQTADLTEVSLVQGQFALMPRGSTSRDTEIVQTYTLVSVTDTLQVAKANAIKWGVCAAFYHNDPEHVTWGGLPFCKAFYLTNGSDGANGIVLPGLESSAARGVHRLVSIVAIRLELFVPSTTLPV